jgi:hypothetical protein
VLLTGTWLVGGTVAVAVGFCAVELVGDEVTERSARPLSQGAVEEALAARTVTSTPPTNQPRGADIEEPPPTPIPSLSSAPPEHTASPQPRGTTTPATTTSTTPTSSGPATKLGSYQVAGGQVGVACTGAVITLRYAVPADGYRSDVHRSPEKVEVEFEGQGGHFHLSVTCRNGEPVSQVEDDD